MRIEWKYDWCLTLFSATVFDSSRRSCDFFRHEISTDFQCDFDESQGGHQGGSSTCVKTPLDPDSGCVVFGCGFFFKCGFLFPVILCCCVQVNSSKCKSRLSVGIKRVKF